MRKKLRNILSLVLLLSFADGTVMFAQDPHFSQFWMSPLKLNPANAGIEYGLDAFINYKNQWKSVTSPYKTYDVAVDMRLNRDKIIKRGFWAAGLDITSDKAGDGLLGTLQADLSLAYHLVLDPHNTLGAGLMGGFGKRSISYSDLQWASQYDGSTYNAALPPGETSTAGGYTFVDLGAGLAWAYRKSSTNPVGYDSPNTDVGISFLHPQQPANAFDAGSGAKLYMKIVADANTRIQLRDKDHSLVLNGLYTKQGTQQELVLGGMFRSVLQEESVRTGYVRGTAFSIGAYYRNKDALIASLMLEIGQTSVGFTYDFNVSRLTAATTGLGGAEISIRFRVDKSLLIKPKSTLLDRKVKDVR